jgi:hypothetical protein
MRCFLIILLAMAFGSTFAQGQYFPKSSLDFEKDEFKAQWYSSQLRALQEPSLLKLTMTTSVESYRFLWLRSFHHPIAIRLEVRPDGTSVLTTKVTNGAGGYRPGALIVNSSSILNREQTRGFLSHIEKGYFWKAPNPVDDQRGTDGSQRVIEGVKGGHYHVVDRWSPKNGLVRELGLLLALDFAKLNIPKDEIY